MIRVEEKLVLKMVLTIYSLTLANSFTVPLLNFNDTCEDQNWISHKLFCYFFSKISSVDAFQATKVCRQSNAQLVSIVTKNEQYFLSSHMNKQYEYWIGLLKKTCEMNSENYWIDGSPLDVTFWDYLEPDEEVCCSRLYNNGLWRDRSCNTPNFRYICKKPNVGRARQSAIAHSRLNGSYVVSDNILSLNIPQCRQVFCSITCLANHLCNGFNMRKNVEREGRCYCEFKESQSWMTLSYKMESDSSYWELR